MSDRTSKANDERTFTPLELAQHLGGWYDRKDLSLSKREETVAFILTNWERLRRSHETCEWCTAGVPRSKDGARHDSIYGVWACRAPAQKAGESR